MLLRLNLNDWESEFGYMAFQNPTLKLAILNSEDFFKIPYKIFQPVGAEYRIHTLTKRLIRKKYEK